MVSPPINPAVSDPTALYGLPFSARALLAPMDGVTDPTFRDLLLELHDERVLGGTFTEFLRVSAHPLPRHAIEKTLGPHGARPRLGLQLMGNHEENLAETARRAAGLGVRLIDINFGCPARGAAKSIAGCALLSDPPRMQRLVRALRRALPPDIPVTAKIRSGLEDDRNLEDLAKAVEDGGAALLTVHCRTKKEAYRDGTARWERIARCVDAVSIPVCGNGGIEQHSQIEAMMRATGAAFAMVGRAAIADPWVFSGHAATPEEARDFLARYAEDMLERMQGRTGRVASRLKQMIRYWKAAGLFAENRSRWLQTKAPETLVAAVLRRAEKEPSCPTPLPKA